MVQHKAKRLTQKEIISQIEQLSPSESLSYRLPQVNGGQLAVVEFSTEYPWRGSKYALSTQALVGGRSVGERERVLNSDEAREIAVWLLERRGNLAEK